MVDEGVSGSERGEGDETREQGIHENVEVLRKRNACYCMGVLAGWLKESSKVRWVRDCPALVHVTSDGRIWFKDLGGGAEDTN